MSCSQNVKTRGTKGRECVGKVLRPLLKAFPKCEFVRRGLYSTIPSAVAISPYNGTNLLSTSFMNDFESFENGVSSELHRFTALSNSGEAVIGIRLLVTVVTNNMFGFLFLGLSVYCSKFTLKSIGILNDTLEKSTAS